MTSMQQTRRRRRVIVGVDTRKFVHVAVALDHNGAVLGTGSFTADSAGYQQLIQWALSFAARELIFAVEGTGSYEAGLTSAIRRSNIGVIEVMRTDRRDRRLRGKSDTPDAENAARSVLAGNSTAVPKTADGVVEMIRQIKVAKDVAVKARTSAMISLKSVLVNAPAELRESLQPLTKMALIDRCAALRPGPVTTVAAATKHTLRSIARRWQQLDAEITAHEAILGELTAQVVPQLVAAFGVGADTASEMLIVAGDNPDRVRSEPAFARLCGVAPIPASSGMTTRHPAQPRRPSTGQRSALPGRHRPHAAPRTDQGLRRPANRRRQNQGRDHPLPQTTPRPRTLGPHATTPHQNRTRQTRRLTAIGASTRWPNRQIGIFKRIRQLRGMPQG